MSRFIDLIGQRFGRLAVLARAENSRTGHTRWLCRCDCGEPTVIRTDTLRSSVSTSCGCLRKEIYTTHGDAKRNKIAKEYSAWHHMKDRCLNPTDKAYAYYGGRGIRVCTRWLNSYENFLADMGRCPEGMNSIDRIENDGNYEPGNCKWTTTIQQARNMRSNVWVSFCGTRMIKEDWLQKLNVCRSSWNRQIKKGLTNEQALRYFIQEN